MCNSLQLDPTIITPKSDPVWTWVTDELHELTFLYKY